MNDCPERLVSPGGQTFLKSQNERAQAKKSRLANALLPNLGDVIFLLVLWIVVFLRPSLLFGDGSIGWHIATGEWILDHHAVPKYDLFSYTFTHKPWVAYEWLFDLILGILHQIGGLNLIQIAVSITLATLYLLIYDNMRANGAGARIACLLVLIGMTASIIHWIARPHLITLIGVFLFSTRLDSFYKASDARQKTIWFLPIFMVFWTNCHPGFLIGILLILTYIICTLTKAVIANGETRIGSLEKSAVLFTILCLSIAGTLLNPYGLSLWNYLKDYLQGMTVLSMTQEYMSPVFHGAISPLCLEILFGMFLISLALASERAPAPSLIASIGFFTLALSAIRHIPLFVIIVLPTIAAMPPHLMQFKPKRLLLAFIESGRAFSRTESKAQLHVFSASAGLILLLFSFNRSGPIKAEFDEQRTPSATLAYLEQHRELATRRGFNFDNWGGLIAYKLHKRVFIDDRADFYGEEFCLRYASIVQTQEGFERKLDQAGIDWILFPRKSDLVYFLKASKRWKEVRADRASSLLVRLKAL